MCNTVTCCKIIHFLNFNSLFRGTGSEPNLPEQTVLSEILTVMGTVDLYM